VTTNRYETGDTVYLNVLGVTNYGDVFRDCPLRVTDVLSDDGPDIGSTVLYAVESSVTGRPLGFKVYESELR
jgi:hypothetical protein